MEKVLKRAKMGANNAMGTQILKGVLFSISISLVGILIFAFLIRLIGVPDTVIMPVNQGIKIVSLFFGLLFALKKDPTKGLLKGVIVGAIYTCVAFLLFSTLSQNFEFSLSVLNDLVFGSLIGGICGIIIANIKK